MIRSIAFSAQRSTLTVKTQEKIVVRCALRVELGKILVFPLILTALCFSSLHAGEPVLKTLAAHVIKVAPDKGSMDVDFRHPATGKVHRLTFYVDGQTGLSKLKSLDELRSGQVVSIDYVEGEKHRLFIRRIARVKLSGPPQGLEKFHGF